MCHTRQYNHRRGKENSFGKRFYNRITCRLSLLITIALFSSMIFFMYFDAFWINESVSSTLTGETLAKKLTRFS